MNDRRRNPLRLLRTVERVAPAVLIVFGARAATAQQPAPVPDTGRVVDSLARLPLRAAAVAPLTVSYAPADEPRGLMTIVIAPRELPRPGSNPVEAQRTAPPGAPASFTGPPTPCTGPCAPRSGIRENQCEDADRDGQCDLVFDPSRQGGFWRALGRYLLLGWIWDRDDDR